MFRGAMRNGVLGARCFSMTRHNLALTTFNMADVGEGIKEVEVLEWFVKEGDRVEELQRLCEVQSDKATAEITSRYTGVIKKIYTKVGDMQQVGLGLVDIDAEEEGEAPAAPAAEAPKAAAPKAAKKAGGAATKTFNLADIGEGIKEVEILSWMVKEGDVIEEMDKLCEVQSDKATVELTTPWAGKVTKVYNAVGDMQQVGAPLLDIEVAGGEEEEEEEAAPAAAAASTPAPAKAAESAPSSGGFKQSAAGAKVLCAPAVRRIAAEKGVDLTQVPPTGKGGRVTKADIIKYAVKVEMISRVSRAVE